ncbi:MAG: hypothetical protein IKK75_07980, partial [Clostridia bacterium]|nr:hypothetical protein [Clostridia bacterium]
ELEGVLYYYEKGKPVEKGLFLLDGSYYFAKYGGKLAVSEKLYAYLTSCDLPKDQYEFGADGKALQGIIDKDGVLYYYENGRSVEKGLICLDGDYYFAGSAGKLVTNKAFYTYLTSCDLPNGYYEFGADGKMVVSE